MYLSVFLSVCVLLAIEPIVSHALIRHTSLSYTQIPQMIFSKMEGRGAHESLPLAEKLPTVHGSYGRECGYRWSAHVPGDGSTPMCVCEDSIHGTQLVIRKEEREAASELGRERCVWEIWRE